MLPSYFVHPHFPHRMNNDGTTDSICPKCFTTVGCSTWEADLDRMEAAHICDPARVACFSQHRRTMPALLDPPEPERTKIPVQKHWAPPALRSRKSA